MDQKIPTGGEKIIQCLEREGVEYVFGLSGGAAMPMFDALVDSKIQLILTVQPRTQSFFMSMLARRRKFATL